MIGAAHGVYWSAVFLMGGSVLLHSLAAAFRGAPGLSAGRALGLAGLVALTAALGLRWVATGHGPYLGLYEALGSYAWIVAVLYLGMCLLRGMPTAIPGVVAMAAAFLLLGAGVLSDGAPQFPSPAMRSLWLWIHVGLAKVAIGSFILSLGLAVAFLGRSRGGGVPQQGRTVDLEDLSVRASAFGFLLLAVVIGAGALWADAVWGAYWTWDPIETWALSSWLMYGLALHARRMWPTSGRRWAIWNAATFLTSVLLFFALRLLASSPHWIYLG